HLPAVPLGRRPAAGDRRPVRGGQGAPGRVLPDRRGDPAAGGGGCRPVLRPRGDGRTAAVDELIMASRPPAAADPTPALVGEVWRAGAPHVPAALLRRYGDLGDCEDAAQEAAAAAAEQWPRDGLPDQPRGWLIRVASRRLIDRVRSDRARADRELSVGTARPADAEFAPGADAERFGDADDTLRLFLLCCHPSLSRSSQVALTLHAMAGLTTEQVAAAYLVPP